MSKKAVAVTFGRANPPTAGHTKLMDKVRDVADKHGADAEMHFSKSQDAKKNPLNHALKVKYLRKLNPQHSKHIKSNADVKDPIGMMDHLHKKGYKEVHMVVGSDRVEGMKHLLNAYNGKKRKDGGHYKFDKIHVHSAGERDPDAEGTSGISASKMRAFAAAGDHKSFHKGLPAGTSKEDSKELMGHVRKRMGITESQQLNEMKMERNRRGELVPSEEQDDRSGHHSAGNWHTESGNYANKLMKRFKRKKDHVSASVWGAEEERHRKAAGKHYSKAFNLDESSEQEFEALLKESFGDAVGAAINHIRLSISPTRKAALHHYLKAKKEGKRDSDALKHAYDMTGIRPAEIRDIHTHYKHKYGNTMATQHMTEDLEPELIDLVEQIESASTAELESILGEQGLESLNETLSRMARMKQGMRMRARHSIMGRKREVAMGRMPSQDVVLQRARRMAIKLMKQRLVRGRNVDELGVGEKERIEKIIAKRGAVIERIARRLVKKVRDIARQRIVNKRSLSDHPAHNPAAKGPVTIGEGYIEPRKNQDGDITEFQPSAAHHLAAAKAHEKMAKVFLKQTVEIEKTDPKFQTMAGQVAAHGLKQSAKRAKWHKKQAAIHANVEAGKKWLGESEQLDEFLGVGKPAAKKPSTVTNKAPQHVSAKGPGKHLAPIDFKTGKEQNTSKRGTKAVFHVESEQLQESDWENRHDEFVSAGNNASSEHIADVQHKLKKIQKYSEKKHKSVLNKIIGTKSNRDHLLTALGAKGLHDSIERNKNAKHDTDARKELGQHLTYAKGLIDKNHHALKESEQETDLTKISTEKLRGLHAIHKHMAGVRSGTAAGKAHAAAAARGAAELKKRGVLVERELTSAEKRKKEEVVMALKRKGETDKSKIYAIATHVAKKMNEQRSSAHVAASVAMDQAIALAMHKAAKKDHNVSDDDCKYVHKELKAMNWLPDHEYFASTKHAIGQSVKQFVHEFNQVRPYNKGVPDDIEAAIKYERRMGAGKQIIAKYTTHIAKLLDPALTEAASKTKKNDKKVKITLSSKKTKVTVNPPLSKPM